MAAIIDIAEVDKTATTALESAKSAHHRLDEHKKQLEAHDHVIDQLSRADAAKDVQIQELCKRMDSLTKAIWGLVTSVAISIFTTLFSFFVWYVQNH